MTSPAATASYEVFARRKRSDPMRHIGCVEAPTPELARVYARTTYDEEPWIEMWIVCRSDVISVLDVQKGA